MLIEDLLLDKDEIDAKYPKGSPDYPSHCPQCVCSGCYASWTEWRGAWAVRGVILDLRAKLQAAERERDDLIDAAKKAIPEGEHPADPATHNWAWQVRQLGEDRRAAYRRFEAAESQISQLTRERDDLRLVIGEGSIASNMGRCIDALISINAFKPRLDEAVLALAKERDQALANNAELIALLDRGMQLVDDSRVETCKKLTARVKELEQERDGAVMMHSRAIAKAADRMREHEKRADEVVRAASNLATFLSDETLYPLQYRGKLRDCVCALHQALSALSNPTTGKDGDT